MTRNTEMHFRSTPQIDLKRSKFDMSRTHTTSFNVGDCVPIYVDCDILPGDTVKMSMAEVIRMATPIYPIMGNIYADLYWFFVPHRLLWDHHAEFWGENEDPWTQTTEYEVPQITSPQGGWTEGTIADYMGIPTKVSGLSVNAFPFRAYSKIWSDWFRDENVKKAAHLYTDETTRQGSNGNNYITDCELGGMPAKVAKFHDYFTSVLPEPQKGSPVTIPLSGNAPITGTATLNNPTANTTINGLGYKPVHTTQNQQGITSNSIPLAMSPKSGTVGNGSPLTMSNGKVMAGTGTGTAGTLEMVPVNLEANVVGITANTSLSGGSINLTNVYADLSAATAATINQLRTAFAIQKYLENAALHGSRYIEYIRGVFGVSSSDARMQRAEYLGGTRVPINIDQILQTSSTDQTSPQGNTAGFSCTINQDHMFIKSFEEHGTLMCIMALRVDRSYQNGLHKMWTRKKWIDYYNPFFAHLGNMPVYNENIYAQGNNQDKEVFGYQEAWAEYRYGESRVSGYMRSNATGSLDVWHLADKYTSLPHYSSEWIDEPTNTIDRVIAVTSQLTHQFIGDFYFKTSYTRAMPVYSVPGLIDHV